MDSEFKARLRKRVPAYLLLIAMVVLVLHYWKKQPADLTVTYRYGRAASGLRSATMVYLRDGRTEVARVRFGYRSRAAEAAQTHQVRLPVGDHEVAIELAYGAGAKTTRTARLRRPVLVRGSGAVTVFVEP